MTVASYAAREPRCGVANTALLHVLRIGEAVDRERRRSGPRALNGDVHDRDLDPGIVGGLGPRDRGGLGCPEPVAAELPPVRLDDAYATFQPGASFEPTTETLTKPSVDAMPSACWRNTMA